jgi:hypothetical protein
MPPLANQVGDPAGRRREGNVGRWRLLLRPSWLLVFSFAATC